VWFKFYSPFCEKSAFIATWFVDHFKSPVRIETSSNWKHIYLDAKSNVVPSFLHPYVIINHQCILHCLVTSVNYHETSSATSCLTAANPFSTTAYGYSFVNRCSKASDYAAAEATKKKNVWKPVLVSKSTSRYTLDSSHRVVTGFVWLRPSPSRQASLSWRRRKSAWSL